MSGLFNNRALPLPVRLARLTATTFPERGVLTKLPSPEDLQPLLLTPSAKSESAGSVPDMHIDMVLSKAPAYIKLFEGCRY